LLRELVGGHLITPGQLGDTFAAALDEVRAERGAIYLHGEPDGGWPGFGGRRHRATSPAPAPARASEAARYADAAEREVDDRRVSDDARVITNALLHVGAAVAEAAERHAEDADTMTAMLTERLTALETALDTVTGVIDPPSVLPLPPLPWRVRLAGLFRHSPGWHAEDGDR
jgi:hypothetical protein